MEAGELVEEGLTVAAAVMAADTTPDDSPVCRTSLV